MCEQRASVSSSPTAWPGRVATRWLPRVTYCTSCLSVLSESADSRRRPTGTVADCVWTDTVAEEVTAPARPSLQRINKTPLQPKSDLL